MEKNASSKCAGDDEKNNGGERCTACPPLTPEKILVIGGLLAGVLDVDSILVDRDQNIEIVLTGSLKQKTQLDSVMEQVGQMPFAQVFKAIMDNA